MHSDLNLAPVDNVVVPLSHSIQSFSDVAVGLLLLYVFLRHGVHVALLDPVSSMYIPNPHSSGDVMPVRGQVLPRGQEVQALSSDSSPSTIPYLPNGQVWSHEIWASTG